ncbi:MAG TPA: GNAT family N-acetyltransferase [Casimicrobiaceae bacterium]|nr:GNAT family N-acetyltransferase [Casimicrobiaceae bacterium]
MHHYLRPLLAPRSVALVGASERPGSLGRIVYENLLAGEFAGELYAINPNHQRIFGRPAFASLDAIGAGVDLAVIASPPETVAGILAQGALAPKSAILMTAPPGNDRIETVAWTRKIVAISRKRKIRVVGPGALGVIRTDIGLNATYCAPPALRGRLALVAQSGAVSAAMLDFAAPMGIGFSSVISLGGGIGVGFGELLDFLLLDSATDGILLYIEDAGDARAFLSALRAAARTKPVVALKAGRSLDPKREPSHDAVFDAALRRAGTVRVQTYAQLFAAARILAVGRIPQGNRLAIVSNGHGPALLAADSASEHGVALAKFTSATISALDALLPQTCARTNPIDVRGNASPAKLAAVVDAALADPNVDAVLAIHVARPVTGATDSARAVADVARKSTKPVFGAWLGALDRREVDAALDAGAIANFFTPENAVEAIAFLAAYRSNQRWLLEVPPSQSMPELPDFAAAERIRERSEQKRTSLLDTADLAQLLAAFGITMPRSIVVETLTEAQTAAAQVRFPVTLMLDSDTHRVTSLRGLRTRDALAKAWAAIHLGGPTRQRMSSPARVVIRRHINRNGASTFAIGVAVDRIFGPVVTLGAGAHMPQATRALMLPPLNQQLAIDLMHAALASIRPDGMASESEQQALQRVLLQVSTLVCALPWVRMLELDPVVVIDGHAQVLNARIVVDAKKKPTPGYRHMAIHPYPVELVGSITLQDGTTLPARPIMPEDAERERAFVHRLSDESRYFRFFYQLHELTPAMLARFTQVDYDRELALVVLEPTPKGEQIIAVARYVANPDRESAEFAIVVGDEWQNRGVARKLMERLIAAAKTRGLVRLQGTVLRTNQKMLRFTTALGFQVLDDPEDSEQVIVELRL